MKKQRVAFLPMLHRLSFAPFPNTAATDWFAAVGDALEAAGAEGLLLANLTVGTAGLLMPAVVVLPGRVAVLQPAPAAALPPQQAALAQWLGTWPELPAMSAAAVAGFIVPADSGAAAIAASGADGWLIVAAPQLAAHLRALTPEAALTAAVLHRWADSLTEEDPAPQQDPDEALTGFWEHKARQLWSWLGAADVPADPPYGLAPPLTAPPADTAAEQQRLEQLRQQLFAELQQQRQATEAREATREQSIAQLRQQLAATPSAAAEVAALQARLAAETQEKNALAATIAASRQEADARNRELEARMQQLDRQVAQLQTRPAATAEASSPPVPTVRPAAPAVASAAPATGLRTASKPAPTRRPAPAAWRLQWPRVALVLLVLALVGVGAVAVQRYSRQLFGSSQPRPRPQVRAAAEDNDDENLEAAAPTLFDIQPDTLRVEADDVDDTITAEPAAPQPNEIMDSVMAPQEGI
ncbi:hypothetical protein CDA63_07585 [Hymenobacter amundsenii]|uniref:Uncharacterized protein n=1 Tax=Hymenobacter amundsenii TaxID=2006685 RepID=A0A246FLL9_9BACT|nr:hypothetical protein [Hymenobacter amundsenii]OWP63646.1 hypothetical protein CDA63_07585 [Hymenobacter amundsenii]